MNKSINFERVVSAELEEIVNIIEELRNTSSTNAKKEILENNKNNEGLQTILELTYNPFKKYKITEKSLKDYGSNIPSRYTNLKELTNKLANSNIDNELRMEVNSFLDETDEIIRDLYKGVLLKDLKIGANKSLINKVWNGLIPTSETGITIKPMLADKYNPDKFVKKLFAVTEKLDGIRCMAVCKEDSITLYSRQGKLIEGCMDVVLSLRKLRYTLDYDFVLDGELLATNCDYSTVYKETIKRVKNKKAIKTGIEFVVFDTLTMSEFENLECFNKYHERLEKLLAYEKKAVDCDHLRFIQVLYMGDDESRLLELLEQYRLAGAEGLMINYLDSEYEFKRSKTLLKVKVMQTADLRVIGFEQGKVGGKFEHTLGSIVVDYKGYSVKANIKGENNLAIREEIWNNKDKYLGKIAEISYFEETHDKDGNLSLRFGVFKHFRDDKTEPSYF